MPNTKKSWRANALLFISSLALCLLLTEGAFRFLYPQDTMARLHENQPAIFQPSEILPYQLKPGAKANLRTPEFSTTMSINSLGYRNRPFTLAKPKNTSRILIIGDSFTFGYGVNDDETYSSRLDRLLGPDAEVINAGFAACYSPDTYYLYFKNEGIKLKPDIVVLGIFIGNDIDHPRSDENEWTRTDKSGLPLQIINKDSVVRQNYWTSREMKLRYRLPILRNSHLFQFIAAREFPIFQGRKATQKSKGQGDSVQAIFHVFRKTYPPRTADLMERVQRLILATDQLAEHAGARLIVLLIPELFQVYKLTLPENVVNMDELDIERPQRLLIRFFQEHKISYVDLLNPLRRQAKQQQLYFWGDRHWTPAAHQIASQAIAEYLRNNKLLESGGK